MYPNAILILGVTSFLFTPGVRADDSVEKNKFVTRVLSEHGQLQNDLVQQWLRGEADSVLSKTLTDLISKEAILRTYLPEKLKESLLSKTDLSSERSLNEKVSAIVREHYRRNGVKAVSLRKTFLEKYTIYPGRYRD